MDRLLDTIAKNANQSPTVLIKNLIEEVQTFAGHKLQDDVAAFAVRII